jgi:hypothetical protein
MMNQMKNGMWVQIVIFLSVSFIALRMRCVLCCQEEFFKRSPIKDEMDQPKQEWFTRLVMKPMIDGWRQQQPQQVFDKKDMGTGNCNGKQFFSRK